jgi:hypothetical protein
MKPDPLPCQASDVTSVVDSRDGHKIKTRSVAHGSRASVAISHNNASRGGRFKWAHLDSVVDRKLFVILPHALPPHPDAGAGTNQGMESAPLTSVCYHSIATSLALRLLNLGSCTRSSSESALMSVDRGCP